MNQRRLLLPLQNGDRVIVYRISGCGVCNDCRRGYISLHQPLPTYCSAVDERITYSPRRLVLLDLLTYWSAQIAVVWHNYEYQK
jgi:hypothetical protein